MIEQLQDVPDGVVGFRFAGEITRKDYDDVRHMSSLFGWMAPGELKVFPLEQQPEATAWAAA